jgi:hypothetical protein
MHVTRLFCPPLNSRPPRVQGDWGGASGLPAGARLLGETAARMRAAEAARILAETRAFQSSHLMLPGERTPTRATQPSPGAHREQTDRSADAGA